ncbi:MAG: hypothetical protein PUC23_05115 [bacterium]|nr:hypothetical protein [bacterium]
MKEKNKKLILTLSCVGILCIFIGVTYAIISFVFQGNREHTIDIKGISFSYEEQENGLSLTKLSPMTDSEGLSSGNDYTFVVSATSQVSRDLPYYVYLTIDNENTLKSEYVRFNITNETTSTTVGPINANKLSLKANNDYYLMGDTFSFDGVTTSMSHTYKLTIWVNEDYEKSLDYTSSNNEQTTTIGGETFNFKINVATGVIPKNLDESGANKPELATNMIPVYYDESAEAWKKADEVNKEEENKWYDYNSKMWANAVTVTETNRDTYMKASAGTAISMDDINTMWVWIPRFSATGDTANYNGGTQSAPGAFDITFVDNKTSAHDAFTFGTQNLNGFWVGKFETSHETLSSSTTKNNLGCTSDTCSNASGIEILPNKLSLRYNNVSNFFYASLSMSQTGNSFGFDKTKDTTLDTHMMKNNEWGAVAYLTQSIYGRCTSSTSCTEVGINNSSSYITGTGAPAGSSSSVTNGTYETALGKDASTTGNIYGVYDMSGGSFEYVMGVYTDGTQNWSGKSSTSNSGFSGCLGSSCSSTYDGVAYPDSKYYNSYTNTGTSSSPITNYTSSMQHALTETKNWFGDYAYFVVGDSPWFGRGGNCYDGSYSGVFYYYYDNGSSDGLVASRSVLAK